MSLQERMKKIWGEIVENNKTIPKLVSLRNETLKAFDRQIDLLLARRGIIKRIKVPKIHISLWSHKGKKIKIPFNWKYLLSSPFIYSMIIPSVIFNLFLEIYHQICFRLYGIPRVNPKEYFIYDRQLLNLLNPWEKLNCYYCSYVNNLIRYSAEIGGRTERYWCPIKYFRRIESAHSQYEKFVSENDSEKMREKWEELRDFSDIKNVG